MPKATQAEFTAAIPLLSTNDQCFAASLLAGWTRHGRLTERQEPWIDRLIDRARNGDKPAEQVGDLSGVMALFETARGHLKHPKIQIGAGDHTIRLSVAGPQARVPGSINVVDSESRDWLGRIRDGGKFEPTRKVDVPAAVIDMLRRFAAEPAKVASEHGRLTGNCCFCRLPLTDERSTAVGYGRDCANNYGLPWGKRPVARKAK